jgi:Zn finger protein HypA/HybF involved in hydrogenase expression
MLDVWCSSYISIFTNVIKEHIDKVLMHELAITQTLCQQIQEAAQQNGITPTKATIHVGEITTYKKEPLLYYFDILKSDYPLLKELTLNIIEVPADQEGADQCIIKSIEGD